MYVYVHIYVNYVIINYYTYYTYILLYNCIILHIITYIVTLYGYNYFVSSTTSYLIFSMWFYNTLFYGLIFCNHYLFDFRKS